MVLFTVNRYTNEVSDIDVLHSLNAKKESARLNDADVPDLSDYLTDSNISIAHLLDLVNKNYPDILPMDVLQHYGKSERSDGAFSGQVKYSQKASPFESAVRAWVGAMIHEVEHGTEGTAAGAQLSTHLKGNAALFDATVTDFAERGYFDAETRENVQDSLVVLDNGNTYVKADRNVITEDTVTGQRKQITEFFGRLLDNKKSLDIQTIEGDVLTITRDETAVKARDNYKTEQGKSVKMTADEFLVKLHAETHIDELAESSTANKGESVDTKNHGFAKDGFTYRTAFFEDLDGQYYKLTLSIGHDGKTATVYNVGKIKKDNLPSAARIVAGVGSKPIGKSSTVSIAENQNLSTPDAENSQKTVSEKEVDVDAVVARMKELAEKAQSGAELTEAEQRDLALMNSELNAILSERALGNEHFIRRLVREDTNAAQRILNGISDMAEKLAVGKSKELKQSYKFLKTAEDLYLSAVAESGWRYENGKIMRDDEREEEQEVKYSLRDAKIQTREELEQKKPIPVVDISTPMTEGTFAERRKQILKKAEEIIKKPYLNRDTNTLIFLTKNSYTHAFNNIGELQLNAAEHLPELIENAVLTHSETPTHGDMNADGVYTFFAAGKTNNVRPIKLKAKEYRYNGQDIPKNIKEYFDGKSQDFASSYDTVVLEIDEIEESPTGSAMRPNQSDSSHSPDELSTISIHDLLDLVKGDAKKYIPDRESDTRVQESRKKRGTKGIDPEYDYTPKGEKIHKTRGELFEENVALRDELKETREWSSSVRKLSRAIDPMREWRYGRSRTAYDDEVARLAKKMVAMIDQNGNPRPTRVRMADKIWKLLNSQKTDAARREAVHDMAEIMVEMYAGETKHLAPEVAKAKAQRAILRAGFGRLTFTTEQRAAMREQLGAKKTNAILKRWEGEGEEVYAPETFLADVAEKLPGVVPSDVDNAVDGIVMYRLCAEVM